MPKHDDVTIGHHAPMDVDVLIDDKRFLAQRICPNAPTCLQSASFCSASVNSLVVRCNTKSSQAVNSLMSSIWRAARPKSATVSECEKASILRSVIQERAALCGPGHQLLRRTSLPEALQPRCFVLLNSRLSHVGSDFVRLR